MTKRSACPRCGAPLAGGGALSGLCPACLLRQGVGEPVACRPAPVTSSTDLSDVQREFPQFEILEEIGEVTSSVALAARRKARRGARAARRVAVRLTSSEQGTYLPFRAALPAPDMR